MLRMHISLLSLAAICLLGTTVTAQQLDLSGTTVIMSSAETEGLGNGPAMFDGDRTTRIATGDNGDGNDNEWVYFDLGGTLTLQEVRIDWEAAFGQDIDLLISNTDPGPNSSPSDAAWRKIAEMRGYDQDGDAPPNHGADVDTVFNFTGGGSVDLVSDLGGAGTGQILETDPTGQWVMMHGIQRGSDWGFSIWEMEVDAVPEPSSIGLLFAGFLGLAGYTRRYLRAGK